MLNSLSELAAAIDVAKTKLDKVLCIEKFVDIEHNDAPILQTACWHKATNMELNKDKVHENSFELGFGPMYDILNCLAGKKKK